MTEASTPAGTRSEWKISLDEARRLVTERFPGAADVAPVQQGLWSSAYGFRTGPDELVVRFSSVRDDFDKDARVSRHAPVSLPVPRIVDIGEALGGYYAVSIRLPGRHLDRLGSAELRRVLPSVFATLDAVREIDVSDTSGYGLWHGDGSGEELSWSSALLDVAKEDPARDPAWHERLAASTLASAAFDAGSARLRELLIHCPEERHLLHSDLLHWNVLVTDDRVSGLLDWGSSIYGDFLYDIAWLTFWWPWYPAWRDVDPGQEAKAHYARIGLEVDRLDERLEACELRIGLGALVWYSSRGDTTNLDLAARRLEELL